MLTIMRGGVEIDIHRVVLKLTGKELKSQRAGVDQRRVLFVAHQVRLAKELFPPHAFQIVVVPGGGNIIRRTDPEVSFGDVTADELGMQATVINALALEEMFNRESERLRVGVFARTLSAISLPYAESYSRKRAFNILNEHSVLMLGGGLGNPRFSTDAAAVERAKELDAGVVLKGITVGGIYTKDPKRKGAEFIPHLTYDEALNGKFKLLDTVALAIARDNNIPIIVFDLFEKKRRKQEGEAADDSPSNLERILKGGEIGTLISSGK